MNTAIETILTSGLPVRERWAIGGVPLDFAFTVGRHGLRRLPEDVLEAGEPAWSDLLAFGEQDFAEGGGARPWLCVRQRDGSVCGFDPEREQPIFPLNSSVERFVETFRLLDGFLGRGVPLPPGCEGQLWAIDPETYPNSDWRLLVEYLRGDEPGTAKGRGRVEASGGGGLRGVEWPVPWQHAADDPTQVAGMERELQREVAAGHPLFGLPVRTLARRRDCDDVLFAVEDGTGRVAVVHLTWTPRPPERPPWPHTVVLPSLAAWLAGETRAESAGDGGRADGTGP